MIKFVFMATVIEITKNDTAETIRRKLEELNVTEVKKKGFPASKFTGAIRSYGDAMSYQQQLRDEWK